MQGLGLGHNNMIINFEAFNIVAQGPFSTEIRAVGLELKASKRVLGYINGVTSSNL